MATTTPSKATQEFVPIKEIRDGIVMLKDGSLRAVIMTSSLNFALKSVDEQNSIIYQFQNFLKGLTSFGITTSKKERFKKLCHLLSKSMRFNPRRNCFCISFFSFLLQTHHLPCHPTYPTFTNLSHSQETADFSQRRMPLL